MILKWGRILLGVALMGGAQGFAGPVIATVGDSTVATQATSPGAGPSRGWGQILPRYFLPDVTFKNMAKNGTSTKSFIDLGFWGATLALNPKPNYIFILFGTNDNSKDAARHTDPKSTYQEYLKRYIDETIGIGAVPILVTPSAIRNFKNGILSNTLSPYVNAMIEVGEEKKVPVIDLNAGSLALYEKMGIEEFQAKFAATPTDSNHYNEQGAEAMAGLILDEIRIKVPALVPFLLPKSP